MLVSKVVCWAALSIMPQFQNDGEEFDVVDKQGVIGRCLGSMSMRMSV